MIGELTFFFFKFCTPPESYFSYEAYPNFQQVVFLLVYRSDYAVGYYELKGDFFVINELSHQRYPHQL